MMNDADTRLDPHADKYNDPRAQFTRRGIALGLAVIVFGILGAIASIYGRRTRLEKTTEFWGPETILALQLGERIELLPRLGKEFPPVELTGTPGLGHLRRSLLDERSFDWTTVDDNPAATNAVAASSRADVEPYVVTLRLTDPTGQRFDEVTIDLDLRDGWAGHSDQSPSVQFAERKRSGLRNFLETIMSKKIDRYDLRSES